MHIRAVCTRILIAALLANVSTSVQAAAPEPSPTVHTWMLPTCPSTDAQDRVGAIGTGLLVSAAGSIIDWIGSALDEAAKEDKEGKATKGTSPAYLWWHTAKSERILMSCVVVVLANSDPDSWCSQSNDGFKPNESICMYFRDKTSYANKYSSLMPANWAIGTALPKLYAEIRLEAATDKRGIMPRLVTLYYPKGIHGRKFANDKPRTFQISVAATTPEGSSALGSVIVRLDDFKPTSKLLTGADIPAGGARVWAAALAIPEKYTPPDGVGPIIPVNVSAEVREIGDPNVFLQALAKAFGSQKDALKDQAKSFITSATSEVNPAAVQSTYDVQAAAVFAAEAKVRNACHPNPPALVNPSTVQSEYLTLLEAHRKLKALPAPAQSIVFSPDFATIEGLHSSTSTGICSAFP